MASCWSDVALGESLISSSQHLPCLERSRIACLDREVLQAKITINKSVAVPWTSPLTAYSRPIL